MPDASLTNVSVEPPRQVCQMKGKVGRSSKEVKLQHLIPHTLLRNNPRVCIEVDLDINWDSLSRPQVLRSSLQKTAPAFNNQRQQQQRNTPQAAHEDVSEPLFAF